jgi:hypothetical protein
MVYWPILDNAIGSSPPLCEVACDNVEEGGEYIERLRVIPCTTASILDHYRVKGQATKTVDYVLAVEPSSRTLATIDGLRREMPGESINHTDFAPLQDRPIVVSIKVKRLDGLDKAQIQLELWLAGQWAKLDEMAGQKTPEFLLAIIIAGHEWSIAASTRNTRNGQIVSYLPKIFSFPVF